MAFRRLQDRPRILEIAYVATLAALRLFRNRLNPGGLVEKVFVPGERVTKGLIFDCKMCGDCVLHNTGMTCPMTCPKNLRNGPCGGVRLNGNCEIIPDMRCVWVEAWERSQKMPQFGSGIHEVLTPTDRRLEGTSSWINDISPNVTKRPVGWAE